MTQNASAPAPSPDLRREARRVASTLVVLSGTDCIGIGSYEPGIATIVQLDSDGVKRRARTAESWQAYIADALVKFAQQHAAAIASATGNSQDAADTLAADTLAADTLAADTLAADTLAADTLAADTLAAEAMMP